MADFDHKRGDSLYFLVEIEGTSDDLADLTDAEIEAHIFRGTSTPVFAWTRVDTDHIDVVTQVEVSGTPASYRVLLEAEDVDDLALGPWKVESKVMFEDGFVITTLDTSFSLKYSSIRAAVGPPVGP